MRLFVGKEKGGKVCRNGICKYRNQFEGLRLELITAFSGRSINEKLIVVFLV